MPVLKNHGHYIVFHATRLDVKTLKMDKGYPRTTDLVFAGVPSDVHDVFQHKGEHLNSYTHYLPTIRKNLYVLYVYEKFSTACQFESLNSRSHLLLP